MSKKEYHPEAERIIDTVVKRLRRKYPEVYRDIIKRTTKNISPTLTTEEGIKSCVLTYQLWKLMQKQKPLEIAPGFTLTASKKMIHVEIPLQLEVKNVEGHRIATIGIFAEIRGKQRTLYINNIQGARKGSEKKMNKLSRALGKNWRVALAESVKSLAKKHRMKTIGLPPPLFYMGVASLPPEQYARVVRQYKQTFRKAGIEIDCRKVTKEYPQESRDIWRTVKKRIKIEERKQRKSRRK